MSIFHGVLSERFVWVSSGSVCVESYMSPNVDISWVGEGWDVYRDSASSQHWRFYIVIPQLTTATTHFYHFLLFHYYAGHFIDENLLLTQYPTNITFSSPLVQWKRHWQLIPGNRTWRQTKKIFPKKICLHICRFSFHFVLISAPLPILYGKPVSSLPTDPKKVKERGRA